MRRLIVGLAIVLSLVLTAAAEAQVVRYYVSDVLPPGTVVINGRAVVKDFYRCSPDDAFPSISMAVVIPTHPTTGVPLFSFCIAYVLAPTALDFAGVDADLRNFRLFQGAEGDQPGLAELLQRLDARWSVLTAVQEDLIFDRLVALGVTTNDINGATSLRAILQKVGRHLQPTFNEAALFVQ